MNTIQSLFLTTAIALGAALPIAAADLPDHTTMSLTRPAGSGSNIGAGNTTAGVAGSTGTVTHGSVEYTNAMVYASAFMGDEVTTMDGKFVGLIDRVEVDSNGNYLLNIDLDDGTYGPNTEVELTVDKTTEADGKLKLGWSEADFKARAQG